MSAAYEVKAPADHFMGIFSSTTGARAVIARANYLIAGFDEDVLEVKCVELDFSGLLELALEIDKMKEFTIEHPTESSDAFLEKYNRDAQIVEEARLALLTNNGAIAPWPQDPVLVSKLIWAFYPDYDPAASHKNRLWEATFDDGFAVGDFHENQSAIRHATSCIEEINAAHADLRPALG